VAEEDSALRLFKALAQQSPLPSLPPLPALHSSRTQSDGEGLAPVPAAVHAARMEPPPQKQVAAAADAAQAPRGQVDEAYIPVEATAPTPAATALTSNAATTTSSSSSAAHIEATVGRKPYWMHHCQRIRSPLLRLHQGGSTCA